MDYLNTLPLELMEYLVQFLDGKSLVNLVILSIRWREYLFNERNKIWQLASNKEIPQDFILDIQQKICPRHYFGDIIPWSEVYMHWYLWRADHSHHFKVSKLLRTKCDIASINISGDWILLGTRDPGSLRAINYHTREKRVMVHECGNIKHMNLKCISNMNNYSDFILDGLAHDKIELQLPNQVLVYDLVDGTSYPHYHLRNFIQRKHFGNHEVYIDGRPTSCEVFSETMLSGKIPKPFPFEHCIYNVLQVWNGRILMMSHTGKLQVYNYKLEPLQHPLNGVTLDVEDIISKNSIHYIWHLDIICILGPFGDVTSSWMDIYVKNKRKRYFTYDEISAMVTSALYHAGILILGSDVGDLYIYIVESDNELLTLELSRPVHKLVITNSQIVTLALHEESRNRAIIAAASSDDVFLIKVSFNEV